MALFEKDADYEAFERVLGEAMEQFPTRLLSYCLMPNHWHLVIWPRKDGELTEFLRWLTHTHVMRWHAHYGTSGTGHLYQGRFKAFPMETDEHFYTVLRYVERNALRANLVNRAEDWRWSSLWRRHFGNAESRKLLSDWPLPRSTRLAGNGQPASDGRRNEGAATLCPTRDSLRFVSVASPNGESSGVGMDTPTAWPPPQGSDR